MSERDGLHLIKEDWQEIARLVRDYKKSLPWYVRLKLWYYRLARRND